MGIINDLTNQVFNRLTVIKHVGADKHRHSLWLCQCDCNGENSKVIVSSNDLKMGKVQSCGCLRKEKSREAAIKRNKRNNEWDLSGNFGIGYTTNEEEFYFDLDDFYKIKNYCWFKDGQGYIATEDDQGKTIKMHRLVMNCPDDLEVDHIYHNLYDNRKEFLRIVTRSQNQMNKVLLPTNTSGITGVSWNNNNEKWVAYITIDYKQIHLGSFDDFDDAVVVRKHAEDKYFGEYKYVGNSNKNKK